MPAGRVTPCGLSVARAILAFSGPETRKITRAAAFKRHILTSKPTKRKRQMRGTLVVADADAPKLQRMLPYK